MIAPAGVMVVPNEYATVAGPAGNTLPFSQADYRYQQIYAADGFPSLVTLTGMAFRHGKDATQTADYFMDIRVDMSITATDPLAMSSLFADNPGPVIQTVYNANTHVVLSGTTLADGTAPFELVLPFSTPFVYDPAQGNLLFDIVIGTNPGAGLVPGMDMAGISSVNTGRVYGASSSATGLSDQAGLIVQFTTSDGPVGGGGGEGGGGTAVPEPASWLLTGLPLGLWVAARRRGRGL